MISMITKVLRRKISIFLLIFKFRRTVDFIFHPPPKDRTPEGNNINDYKTQHKPYAYIVYAVFIEFGIQNKYEKAVT